MASTSAFTASETTESTPCATGLTCVGRTAASIKPSAYSTGSVVKTLRSWNSGNTCANMHQVASVLARFWIQPPLFHSMLANVGASNSARPQYHACVGRLLYVYSKFHKS